MRTVIATILAFIGLSNAAAAEQLWLTMDQVRPYKLENPAQSIVVGNPAIADVTVQDNKNLLLFGKAPGLTNIYIFDEAGEPVQNLMVRVRTMGSGMLTLNRGVHRTTYNCTTNCEATATVGDGQDGFATVANQVAAKLGQAQAAATEDE
ncbi:MAG: hypothetical protein HKN14_02425 [Marinicaulis sp.]|nr:pilus assembly protein N-terminal domain-containing protein [Marinicaulis sp.]NNE39755.1 hypothetical protein [Marinicaulis sp.]NNL89944.1 hypothetical protein [Marinicaulis sp.]